MKKDFLVETALLGQGLTDCDNQEIADLWKKNLPADLEVLAWIWQGEVIIGAIDEFLKIRNCKGMGRYNMYNLAAALDEKRSGFLTAGATMKVAADLKKKIVVSCGLGGASANDISSDYPALCQTNVVLFATAVKDMFSIQDVWDYMHNHGYEIWGIKENYADGYLFVGEKVPFDGIVSVDIFSCSEKCRLILNPIAREKRLRDRTILQKALEIGDLAEAKGEYFHPAVNKALTDSTNGKTSQLQLKSLLDNIRIVYDSLQ